MYSVLGHNNLHTQSGKEKLMQTKGKYRKEGGGKGKCYRVLNSCLFFSRESSAELHSVSVPREDPVGSISFVK